MTTSDLRNQRENPNAVCIARGVPPGWKWRVYHDLAPSRSMLALESPEAYDVAFAAQLSRLDPAKVFADLGDAAVLCCWERGDRCHRRSTAEFLEAALGIEIPELGFSRAETPGYAAMPIGPARKKRPSRQLGLEPL